MATENGPDLSAGQAAVEALMDDTCTVHRPGAGGSVDLDPVTLTPVAVSGALVYDGKCLLKAVDQVAIEASQGGQAQTLLRYQLKLPLGSLDLQSGDVVTITSTRRDPNAPGSMFLVDEQLVKTMAISITVLLSRRRVNR